MFLSKLNCEISGSLMLEPQSHELLDVSDHQCPIPVLRLRRMLEKIDKGATIKLTATDPMTLIDIPNFCRETSNVIEETHESDDEIIYIIRKS